MPAHWHPIFADRRYKKGEFPNSVIFYLSEISIPMFSTLKEKEIDFIIKKMDEVISHLN
jgi:dTDP-4-amino-4,6-dideoxygalactose transaminase